ncbi:MliC family protein [Gymnodinialimonas ulvae]|uniref:MliC family protein n=1 Tax=Gymnodinialimonas ulvae TaxID=3126504 RepID=UPI0030A802A1
MHFKSLLVAAAALTALPFAAQANVNYQCSSNVASEQITATLFDEEDVVVVYYVQAATGLVTNEILMRPAPSGSGFRYTGQGLDFIGRGDEATFTDGSASVSCYVSSVDVPGGGQAGGGGYDPQVGPFAGFSFGGNLRDGPGTNFRDVGSTFEGQPLTLLTDTGLFFNGYSWWVVVLQNGQQAYQWGGIICAPGYQLSGVFNEGC